MANTKKSKSSRKGRTRVYNKTTLRARNIFGKKSASSQAKQIYALNKRVNYINKHMKPETKLHETLLFRRIFTQDGTLDSDTLRAYDDKCILFKERLFKNFDGTDGYQMLGNILRPYNFTITGIFSNKCYSYVHDYTATSVSQDVPMTGYLKIFVCRLLRGDMSSLPSKLTKSWDPDGTDAGLVVGPLNDRISGSLKIVRTKLIKVNNKNPAKCFKITVKNPGTYKRTLSTAATYNLNEYVIYYQYFSPDLLVSNDGANVHQLAPIHALTEQVKACIGAS